VINLFYAPHACSLVSHITLQEAGAAYTAVRVDFAKSEQRQPEYLAINPKERVGRVSAMRAARMRACARLDLTFWLSAAVIAD
jgi:glutathione S-transferase